MLIKTADGHEKQVASRGLAGTALGLGIAGTAGLLMNNNGCGCNNGGILRNLFGNNNNECYVTKYELAQNEAIGALESKIAYLEGVRYTDSVGQELYRQSQIERNADKDTQNGVNVAFIRNIAELDKATAVNKMEIDKNLVILDQKTDFNFALLKKDIKSSFDLLALDLKSNYYQTKKVVDFCDICPTPQILEKVEQPTRACTSCAS